MNCVTNALIGPAAAYIAGHRFVDVRVRRVRPLSQKRRGAHDLTRLAVAALGHILGDPCFLQRVTQVCGKAFDRGHFLFTDRGDRHDAGTCRLPVDVDGACPAKRHAAPELCTRHAQGLTQYP